MKMDIIDSLRHWLIRKLSCGDLIMMNFDIRPDGSIDNRNLGPVVLANVSISGNGKDVGVSAGKAAPNAKLAILRDVVAQDVCISKCLIGVETHYPTTVIANNMSLSHCRAAGFSMYFGSRERGNP